MEKLEITDEFIQSNYFIHAYVLFYFEITLLKKLNEDLPGQNGSRPLIVRVWSGLASGVFLPSPLKLLHSSLPVFSRMSCPVGTSLSSHFLSS